MAAISAPPSRPQARKGFQRDESLWRPPRRRGVQGQSPEGAVGTAGAERKAGILEGTMVQKITGGVCAAQGFTAGATRCGVKASSAKDDTAILYEIGRAHV